MTFGDDMETIRNFVALTDRIGTAGQPTAGQFKIIADNGYGHVINLAMPDHPDSLANEGDLVTKQGMSYIHIPVPFDRPTPAHVRQFCGMMSVLSDEKVFVHCIMNYRVSVFMFHYLGKVLNLSEKKSKSIIFDSWQPNAVWQRALNWSAAEIGL